MHASCFQTPHWGTCADLSLTVSFLSDPDFRTQPLWIHTLATSESVSPLESTLTKFAARVSKHAALTPVESALTETHPLSPLESTLTKKGVGGGGSTQRVLSSRPGTCPERGERRGPGPGARLKETDLSVAPANHVPPVTSGFRESRLLSGPVTVHGSRATSVGHSACYQLSTVDHQLSPGCIMIRRAAPCRN
jgi:hypothetical protein